jgi:hypothetical protein
LSEESGIQQRALGIFKVTIVGKAGRCDLDALFPALMSAFLALDESPAGYLHLANGLFVWVSKSTISKESLKLLVDVFEPIRLYRDSACDLAVSGLLPFFKKHILNPDSAIASLARTSLARFAAPKPGDRR